jgi:hypothetical protein
MLPEGLPDSADRGKFDHDLKARAARGRPAKAGTRPADRTGALDRRDSMTLPSDSTRDEDPGPQPEAAPTPLGQVPAGQVPVDNAPEILQREPLHFIVVLLLLADIVFGLGLAVFAEKVLAFRPMAVMGCGLAALGLGILGYFVLVGGGKRSRW